MIELLFGIKLFVFVFCCLIILRNLYNFIKVLRLKEGKVETSTVSLFLLGSAWSYVITLLIMGF